MRLIFALSFIVMFVGSASIQAAVQVSEPTRCLRHFNRWLWFDHKLSTPEGINYRYKHCMSCCVAVHRDPEAPNDINPDPQVIRDRIDCQRQCGDKRDQLLEDIEKILQV